MSIYWICWAVGLGRALLRSLVVYFEYYLYLDLDDSLGTDRQGLGRLDCPQDNAADRRVRDQLPAGQRAQDHHQTAGLPLQERYAASYAGNE